MPSINLLPENFTIEAYKKKERIAVYILAALFLLASVVIYAQVEIGKQQEEKKSVTLDASIEKVKTEIQKSVEASDLLSSDYNKSDIEKLLKEHTYYSRALTFLKDTVVNDVYVSGMKISAKEDGTFPLELSFYAKDYDNLLNQSSVFQNSFWVKSVSVGGLKYEKEKGISCAMNLVLKKDYFIFHDQYWDFGMGALVKNSNKYIEVSNYSVVLKKNTGKNADNGSQSVLVSFDGKAYDADKLDEFEKKLKETDNVTDVKIDELNSSNSNPGVSSFRGSVTLKY